MNNLKSLNWDINEGDYIHYELSLVKIEKIEKLVKNFFAFSLIAVSLVLMLTVLNLAAKV